MRLKRSAVAAIIFWALFLLSIAAQAHYVWVDRVWLLVLLIGALATSIYFTIDSLRSHREGLPKSIRGYPRWFIRFAYDEGENARRDATHDRAGGGKTQP